MICCYQITKIFSTKYGSTIASLARGPFNFCPLADLEVSVFREMIFNTLFTQILTSFLNVGSKDVVGESKCLGTLTLEFSITLVHPFLPGFKQILRQLLVLRNLAVWI